MGQFEDTLGISWQADGKPSISIPGTRLTEEYSNALAKRKRAYKKGERLDNMSREGLTWTIEALFYEGIDEPGMPTTGVYPNLLGDLCLSFEVETTGSLTLPTRGLVRAQLKSYRRVEEAGERDQAAVSFVFWEDSEDDVTDSSFLSLSPKVGMALLAQQIVEECQAAGAWGAPLLTLNELIGQLTALIEAPGAFVDDINAKANAVINQVGKVEDAFVGTGKTLSGVTTKLLSDPSASLPGRLLRKCAGLASITLKDSPSANATTTTSFSRVVSIFDVAAQTGQDVGQLLQLNTGLANPFQIPAGTTVRVLVAA